MKEMVYGQREKAEVLYFGEYKNHKFAILSLGSHPTAYIENKMDITDYNDCRLDSVSVHGGFTFCGNGHWGEESYKISWLGRDYAHGGDFCGYDSIYHPCFKSAKRWTTAEIYNEVKSVINQVIEVEKYNDSREYKEIKKMIAATENTDKEVQRACQTLYEKGYRNQSDTVREFVGKILKIGSKRPLCLFNEYKEGYIDCIENIKKIAAQYGVEVEE